jgi:hypothetical protein
MMWCCPDLIFDPKIQSLKQPQDSLAKIGGMLWTAVWIARFLAQQGPAKSG